MAEFPWMRIAQRSRTPSIPKSPTPSKRVPSRVPSSLSLKDGDDPLSPQTPLTAASNASFPLFREHENLWHNPSLDQMVEALQVEIMTNGVLHPIHVKFNSYILHLVEGFVNSQDRVRAVENQNAQVKLSLEQNLEHFKSVADEWLERESQYKAEVKRLEVLLSRASRDGLEAVTLARTNSVVDRNGPHAKRFVSTLKRLSGQSTETSPDKARTVNKRESEPTDIAKYSVSLEQDHPQNQPEKSRR